MPYCDAFNRPIEYLRISVTDRCNLRCVYCMPEEGVPPLSHQDILSYEEIARVARLVVGLGVSKLRVTGGEPLVRKGVERLIEMLAAIPGVDDLSMTTNGMLLASMAGRLAEAGLDRVNVSLDTLRPERFQAMTRRGRLEEVLEGIAAAEAAGLSPVKINVVVIRGLNDDEVLDFARKTTPGTSVSSRSCPWPQTRCGRAMATCPRRRSAGALRRAWARSRRWMAGARGLPATTASRVLRGASASSAPSPSTSASAATGCG